MSEEVEIIRVSGSDIIEAQQRAEIDVQISTAKAYPRDLTRVKNDCIAIVTMDTETAASCRYVVPKGGKNISGGSVHLARILAQQYGNVRVDSKIKAITESEIISEGVAFDLQTNYAVKVEVRKNILQNEYIGGRKTGKKVRMNEDMITVIGNAANAIAFRNAVFAIVPKAIVDACYSEAVKCLSGDLSDETKLIAQRKKALDYFKDTYNAGESDVLKVLGLNSINQIKAEQIVDMRGIMQSLKDGDTTADILFGRIKPESVVAENPLAEKKPESAKPKTEKEIPANKLFDEPTTKKDDKESK